MENLLVFMLLAFANSVIGDGCCKIKVVGGSTYTFTGEEDTSTFSCVDKCTYAKEGVENSKYCFAVGSMQVECKVAGSDEAGSTGSNEVPETTAGAVGGAETTIGADETAASFSGGSVPTLTTTPMPMISEEEILANLLSNDSRILNADGFGSLPQQVFIEIKGFECTGTMITDSLVITAGHCFPDSFSNSDIKVYRPQGKCNGRRFIRGCKVSKWLTGGQGICDGHDIALIRLEKSMSGMRTLTLNYHPNFNYYTVMAGTGTNNYGNTCHSLYSYQKKIDCREVECYGEQWYCTRGYSRYQASGGCEGDSGGPSWAANRYGGGGLAGLTNQGPTAPCTNDWTAFTNLAYYQDWIKTEMRKMKKC